ncbi:YhgE/Pip family protein [Thalassobacillus hwangdonensis]|uniref:YhgE/Pip family protein n=1 Tax=Thalassobacillus hwangdonensis TaxID=546108 RepID=A0ABW3KX02_9BACI
MNGIKGWWGEMKAITANKKIFIPFIAVLLIPLIYSGMFLWAFWNPYGNMDELPVAVVNSDKGAELEGEPLHVGEEFIDKLQESKDFDYKLVAEKEGKEGLENQEYYMMIEIPQDFSEKAATVMDDNPQPLELSYIPNEGYNFLSAQIGGSAAEQMKSKLADEVTETYTEAILSAFKDVQTGLAEASDKAGDLNDGAEKIETAIKDLQKGTQTFASGQRDMFSGAKGLEDGANQLAQGLNQLTSGLGKLNSGFQSLKEGESQAAKGASELKQGLEKTQNGTIALRDNLKKFNELTNKVPDQLNELSSAMQSLQDGTGQLTDATASMKSEVQASKEKMAPILAQLPEEQRQAVMKELEKLEAGVGEINGAASQLNQGATKITEKTTAIPEQMNALTEAQQKLLGGANQLVDAQGSLVDGASKLVQGENQLEQGMLTFQEKLKEAESGSAELANGANELANGSSTLVDGANQLVAGADRLEAGSGELASGSQELTSGTSEFKEKLQDSTTTAGKMATGELNQKMIANPVELKTDAINDVPNYGAGFTPYFLSLGLFVGALIITVIYPVKEPLVAPASGFSWFLSKFGVLVFAGIIQAVVAASVILYGLQLEVSDIGMFYLFSILTSLTFMAMIQLFVTILGDSGRFLAILLLILQLTTSAGTFPLELIPEQLQWFNPFLPMTYSVQGYKAVISEGNLSLMGQNASILAIFLVVSAIMTSIYLVWQFPKKKHLNTIESNA